MSAENSGKPKVWASLQRSPDPLAGGEGGCCPSPRTPPRCRPSVLRSRNPNNKNPGSDPGDPQSTIRKKMRLSREDAAVTAAVDVDR